MIMSQETRPRLLVVDDEEPQRSMLTSILGRAGFAVDADSLPQSELQLTHVNLNDQTLEGFRHRYLPVLSVQYHPEASPGPRDSLYLFDEFVQMMDQA